jgi:hypothetical protein
MQQKSNLTTRGLFILITPVTAGKDIRIFSLCHYFATKSVGTIRIHPQTGKTNEQLAGKGWELIGRPLRPAIINEDVPALHVAELAQPWRNAVEGKEAEFGLILHCKTLQTNLTGFVRWRIQFNPGIAALSLDHPIRPRQHTRWDRRSASLSLS